MYEEQDKMMGIIMMDITMDMASIITMDITTITDRPLLIEWMMGVG